MVGVGLGKDRSEPKGVARVYFRDGVAIRDTRTRRGDDDLGDKDGSCSLPGIAAPPRYT